MIRKNNHIADDFFKDVKKSKLLKDETAIFTEMAKLESKLISLYVDKDFTTEDTDEICNLIGSRIAPRLKKSYGIFLNLMLNKCTPVEVKATKVLEIFKKINVNYAILLKTDEQKKIAKQIKILKDHVIVSNLKRVVSLAKGYQNHGIQLEDLVQEGNIGLIKAASKFDYKMNCTFNTYATWWIRHAITDSLVNNGRLIRIPVYLVEEANKLVRTMKYYVQKHKHMPTIQELAKISGLEEDKIKAIFETSKEPYSLEFPVGDSDKILEDFVYSDDFDEDLFNKDIIEFVDNALGFGLLLEPLEEMVIRLKYNI